MRLKLWIGLQFFCLHDAVALVGVFFGEVSSIDGYIFFIGMLHEYVINEALVLVLAVQFVHTLLEPFLERHLDLAADALRREEGTIVSSLRPGGEGDQMTLLEWEYILRLSD